jgi:outer membrane lipoprotein-sorting protein
MLSLIALLALLQQETAEELFKRIEQSLEQAKSVRVIGRLDIGQNAPAADTLVLLKDDNKAKVSMTTPQANAWFVSDGKKITVDDRQAALDGKSWDTPKDLNVRVTAALLRRGVLDLSPLAARIRTYGTDPKQKIQVSDFKLGGKDGDLQTLTFVLQEGNARADVKLWMDPRSLALKKRTLSLANSKIVVTETYDEFTLNGDIPDEKFKP